MANLENAAAHAERHEVEAASAHRAGGHEHHVLMALDKAAPRHQEAERVVQAANGRSGVRRRGRWGIGQGRESADADVSSPIGIYCR
jgi:hypothetical protein